MKNHQKGIAYVLSMIGSITLMSLPTNKYDWMKEVDPAIRVVSNDSTADEKILFSFLVLIVLVIAQAFVFAMAVNRTEKVISMVLVLA